jgi:hypothetical protein
MCLTVGPETGTRNTIFADSVSVQVLGFRGLAICTHLLQIFKACLWCLRYLELLLYQGHTKSIMPVVPTYSPDRGFMKLGHQDCVDSLICSHLSCLYRQRLAKAISLCLSRPGGVPGCRHKFGNSLLMKILELDELIWEGV